MFTNITNNLEIKPLYEAIAIDDPVDDKKGCKKDLVYLVSSFIALTSVSSSLPVPGVGSTAGGVTSPPVPSPEVQLP